MTESVMRVQNIAVKFGGLWALQAVDMDVRENEILGIMGPNGAGKSTFLNVMSGLQRPTSGQMTVNGQHVAAGRPWQMTRLGLSRSFQTVRLLEQLTVLENVLIGGHIQATKNPLSILLRTRSYRKKEKELKERAFSLLRLTGLANRADDAISSLSVQERRRVEIARSLMPHPKVLLLDEPCAGLSPHETAAISQLIMTIRNEGISVILVEHNVKMVLSLSDQILVLDHGRCIAKGTPQDVSKNEAVIKAYLGGAEDA
ncbi:MAG: ABC transporter ATP-binding protein [Sporolactobacillus sp.]